MWISVGGARHLAVMPRTRQVTCLFLHVTNNCGKTHVHACGIGGTFVGGGLIFARSAMEDEAESPAMNTATFQSVSPPAHVF
jgi:hypothetical protein